MWDGLKSKVRNQVKKPRKAGLTVERGGAELLPHFFRVYSENMRDLGSPSHSRRFFQAVMDNFPEDVSIYVVWHDGRAIGAGFTMANGDRLEIPWASSLRRYNSLCVNHLMYWQVMEDACRDGFQWFHFGRSTRDSGPYRFKLQWGSEPEQLHWYYLAPDAKAAARASSLEQSYGWGTKLWQRLPLWLTRRIGPRIVGKVA
jgi:FemAB-related protein (PEP-CTERM system-associated)